MNDTTEAVAVESCAGSSAIERQMCEKVLRFAEDYRAKLISLTSDQLKHVDVLRTRLSKALDDVGHLGSAIQMSRAAIESWLRDISRLGHQPYPHDDGSRSLLERVDDLGSLATDVINTLLAEVGRLKAGPDISEGQAMQVARELFGVHMAWVANYVGHNRAAAVRQGYEAKYPWIGEKMPKVMGYVITRRMDGQIEFLQQIFSCGQQSISGNIAGAFVRDANLAMRFVRLDAAEAVRGLFGSEEVMVTTLTADSPKTVTEWDDAP